ncbi:MAG: ABC transporter ATP-binding protein [Deltaproteobacteria bacterium]|nr:MAG: ABC transporter ATP-binding protein [Deltaproteobacteria bacterium]
MEAAISINKLSKTYKKTEALKSLSLEIPMGEFFGLLGPNGAGKTTLIKTIVGLARPTSGSILVFGQNIQDYPLKTKAVIGLSPQEQNIDRYFTVRKILEFQGGYFGLRHKERRQKAEELLGKFNLTDKVDEEFWKLSGGMQRRVMIARSLMASPKILILDEPTAGIDVEQRHELWDFLKNLNRDGTTIILTTHYIDEAEYLCERVAIIDAGQIVEMGFPKELIKKHCEQYFLVNGEKKKDLMGLTVDQVQVHQGDLEQVFIKLTGKKLESA